ncbi:MAG TPA: hypothetical protein VGF26_17535, partial [Ramlibacter sp.]
GGRPDGSSKNAAMLLDASGRFVLTNSTLDLATGSPFAEDVFLGTAIITGTTFTATSVTFLHRDAGATNFRQGSPVAINGIVGTTSAGAHSLQLTIAGTAVPPIDTALTLNSGHQGYAWPPYTVPVWTANNGALTATADGRVIGTLAPDCTIDAAISVTDPTRDVYRMQATFAGSGCAAKALVPGTGEFLGSRFIGPSIAAYGPPAINFVGIVGSTAVRLGLDDAH